MPVSLSLQKKGIPVAIVSGIEDARGGRKVAGIGIACHKRAPGWVEAYVPDMIGLASTQIRPEEQAATSAAEPNDETIALAVTVGS